MLIRIFTAIFILFISSGIYAKTIFIDNKYERTIEFNNQTYEDKYKPIIDDVVNYAYKNYPTIQKKHLRIRVFVGKDVGSSKYSRYAHNFCDIKLAYEHEASFDFGTLANELEIVTLHELGHCALEDVLPTEKKITWRIPLKEEEKAHFNLLSKEDANQINLAKCEPNCTGRDIPFNVFVSYGELFADLFSVNYYLEKNNEDMPLLLVSLRETLYFQNGKSQNYFSHKVISDVLNKEKHKALSYEELVVHSQRALLDNIKSR